MRRFRVVADGARLEGWVPSVLGPPWSDQWTEELVVGQVIEALGFELTLVKDRLVSAWRSVASEAEGAHHVTFAPYEGWAKFPRPGFVEEVP